MSRKPKGKTKTSQPSASNPATEKLLLNILSFFAFAVILLTSISRVVLSKIPLSRDEGTYGYLGKLAVKGFTPYVDFYEMKPPMLYYLYGLGGSVFGFTDIGLRLFGLLLNLGSGLLLYLILQRYTSKTYALVATALFSVLSTNLFAFGFTTVAEHIVNTLVLLALFLVHLSVEQKGFRSILLAGAMFALAILTKQTAILLSPVFLFYFIMERGRKPWLTQCIWFAAGAIVPVILLTAMFVFNGGLSEAIYWLITYPSNYTSNVSVEEGKVMFGFFSRNILRFQSILFIIGGLALIGNIFHIKAKPNAIFLTYFLLAALALFPGLRFYGQYWLLMFVPLAMLTGTALHQLNVYNRRLGMISAAVVLMCILIEFGINRDYYFLKESTAGLEKLYKNNPFLAIRELSTHAGQLMKPEETLMVMGSEPQAYLYAGKAAPTRHIFMSMISKSDDKSLELAAEALNDLKTQKPTYVLFNLFPFSWGLNKEANTKLYTESLDYTNAQYIPVAAYDMATKKYLYADQGQTINPTRPTR